MSSNVGSMYNDALRLTKATTPFPFPLGVGDLTLQMQKTKITVDATLCSNSYIYEWGKLETQAHTEHFAFCCIRK